MSDAGNDEQDQAELLDSDHLGTADDPDIEPGFPADRPLGVDEYGLTAAEEQVGEPLEERVERETPDPLLQELDGIDTVTDPVDDGAVPAEEAALHVDDGAALVAADPLDAAGSATPPVEDRPPA